MSTSRPEARGATPRSLAALAFALALLGACSLPFTTPQRPLESGEVVAQGSLDLPGFFYVPRASGSLTAGFGRGDVGGHIGTSLFSLHMGAHGRAYLDPAVVSLQGTVITDTFEEGYVDLLTSTLRVGNLPKPDLDGDPTAFFGGGEISTLAHIDDLGDEDTPLREADLMFLPGVYGGFEHRISEQSTLGAEGSLRFAGFGLEDGEGFAEPVFWPQIGINLQRSF